MATKLDIADAQIVGFSFARDGFSTIIKLIESMGLTKSEWIKWKRKYPTSTLLESEIIEIDKYFNIKPLITER